MPEPTALAGTLAAFISQHKPGSRMHQLGRSLLLAHGANQDRRAAVIKHPDLAGRVVKLLGLRDAGQWSGYIPPHLAVDDDGGLLRVTTIGRDGQLHVRFNQNGARSCGPVYNTGPARLELLEVSAEAWRREHEETPAPE